MPMSDEDFAVIKDGNWYKIEIILQSDTMPYAPLLDYLCEKFENDLEALDYINGYHVSAFSSSENSNES